MVKSLGDAGVKEEKEQGEEAGWKERRLVDQTLRHSTSTTGMKRYRLQNFTNTNMQLSCEKNGLCLSTRL